MTTSIKERPPERLPEIRNRMNELLDDITTGKGYFSDAQMAEKKLEAQSLAKKLLRACG